MYLIKKYSIVWIGLVLAWGCTHNHDDHGHEHDHGHSDDEMHHEEGLHLTSAQMRTVGIEFGDFTELKINSFIKAVGTLGLPPNAKTAVSPKASGLLRSSRKFVEGDFVKMGSLVGHVENPDFLSLQDEYLQLQSALKFSRAELARQKKLLEENAGVEKAVQASQAKLAGQEVRLMTLKKKLEYLGIEPDELSLETLHERISIYAPASGYIAEINMHNGSHVGPQDKLLELVDTKHVHLELDILEQDASRVEVGQKITYVVPANGVKQYSGEISVLGREYDAERKTVRVHGHLTGEEPRFIMDLFINAKIWLDNDVSAALPEGAIIRDGAISYIYAANAQSSGDETEFAQLMVVGGEVADGYQVVTLIDSLPKGYSIVTKGAYYVYAQGEVGELSHEH